MRKSALAVIVVLFCGGGAAAFSLYLMAPWERRLTLVNFQRQFDGNLNYRFIEIAQSEYAICESDQQKVEILLWVALHHDANSAHESEEAAEMAINSKVRNQFMLRVKTLLSHPAVDQLSQVQRKTLFWFVAHENEMDNLMER